MAKYDDASWHYAGNYPKELPKENASTHIGMFLTWCIDNDLISADHIADSNDDIEGVKNRRLTGAQFLINNCDEKFTDLDLNKIGSKFAKDYYSLSKKTKFISNYADYLDDYAKILNHPSTEIDLYEVENSWENYDY
jgi:hypothetical protein